MSKFKGAFDNLGERPKLAGVRDVRIQDIKVGDRFRKDLGDLNDLVASINDVGLLHPVVLLPDMKLVAGGRRVAAFKQMGRESIPGRIVDNLQTAEAVLRAERDENTARKPFTASEMAAIAEVLLPQAKAEAAQRKAASLKKGTENPRAEKFSQRENKGRALDQVAAVAGVSGITLRKAKKIVESGDRDLIEAVDKGQISIDKAAQIVAGGAEQPDLEQPRKKVFKKDGPDIGDSFSLLVPLKIGKRKFLLTVAADDKGPISEEEFIQLLRQKLAALENNT